MDEARTVAVDDTDAPLLVDQHVLGRGLPLLLLLGPQRLSSLCAETLPPPQEEDALGASECPPALAAAVRAALPAFVQWRAADDVLSCLPAELACEPACVVACAGGQHAGEDTSGGASAFLLVGGAQGGGAIEWQVFPASARPALSEACRGCGSANETAGALRAAPCSSQRVVQRPGELLLLPPGAVYVRQSVGAPSAVLLHWLRMSAMCAWSSLGLSRTPVLPVVSPSLPAWRQLRLAPPTRHGTFLALARAVDDFHGASGTATGLTPGREERELFLLLRCVAAMLRSERTPSGVVVRQLAASAPRSCGLCGSEIFNRCVEIPQPVFGERAAASRGEKGGGGLFCLRCVVDDRVTPADRSEAALVQHAEHEGLEEVVHIGQRLLHEASDDARGLVEGDDGAEDDGAPESLAVLALERVPALAGEPNAPVLEPVLAGEPKARAKRGAVGRDSAAGDRKRPRANAVAEADAPRDSPADAPHDSPADELCAHEDDPFSAYGDELDRLEQDLMDDPLQRKAPTPLVARAPVRRPFASELAALGEGLLGAPEPDLKGVLECVDFAEFVKDCQDGNTVQAEADMLKIALSFVGLRKKKRLRRLEEARGATIKRQLAELRALLPTRRASADEEAHAAVNRVLALTHAWMSELAAEAARVERVAAEHEGGLNSMMGRSQEGMSGGCFDGHTSLEGGLGRGGTSAGGARTAAAAGVLAHAFWDEDRLTVEVPNGAVSFLIGVKGASINMLQERCGTRIQVDKNQTPSAPQRKVWITAPAAATVHHAREACEACARAVAEKIDEFVEMEEKKREERMAAQHGGQGPAACCLGAGGVMGGMGAGCEYAMLPGMVCCGMGCNGRGPMMAMPMGAPMCGGLGAVSMPMGGRDTFALCNLGVDGGAMPVARMAGGGFGVEHMPFAASGDCGSASMVGSDDVSAVGSMGHACGGAMAGVEAAGAMDGCRGVGVAGGMGLAGMAGGAMMAGGGLCNGFGCGPPMACRGLCGGCGCVMTGGSMDTMAASTASRSSAACDMAHGRCGNAVANSTHGDGMEQPGMRRAASHAPDEDPREGAVRGAEAPSGDGVAPMEQPGFTTGAQEACMQGQMLGNGGFFESPAMGFGMMGAMQPGCFGAGLVGMGDMVGGWNPQQQLLHMQQQEVQRQLLSQMHLAQMRQSSEFQSAQQRPQMMETRAGDPSREEVPRFEQQVTVPQCALGLVIGRGGENIKAIRSELDVRVDLETDESAAGKGERLAFISAQNAQSLQEAVSRVQGLVDRALDNKARRQSGSFHGAPHYAQGGNAPGRAGAPRLGERQSVDGGPTGRCGLDRAPLRREGASARDAPFNREGGADRPSSPQGFDRHPAWVERDGPEGRGEPRLRDMHGRPRDQQEWRSGHSASNDQADRDHHVARGEPMDVHEREVRPEWEDRGGPPIRDQPLERDERQGLGERGGASDESWPPLGDRGPRDARGPWDVGRPSSRDDRGPPRDDRWPSDRGPLRDGRRLPDRRVTREDRGPPNRTSLRDNRGSQHNDRGPPHNDRGPPHNDRGPPHNDRGPHDDRGPPHDDRGPPHDDRGPPHDDRGPPHDDRGPPHDDRGPRHHDRGPSGRGPRGDDRRLPGSDRRPPWSEYGPHDSGLRRDDHGPPRNDNGPYRNDRGPPDSASPRDDRSPSRLPRGPPRDERWSPRGERGQARDERWSPRDNRGPPGRGPRPAGARPPPRDERGPPPRDERRDERGPPPRELPRSYRGPLDQSGAPRFYQGQDDRAGGRKDNPPFQRFVPNNDDKMVMPRDRDRGRPEEAQSSRISQQDIGPLKRPDESHRGGKGKGYGSSAGRGRGHGKGERLASSNTSR